MRLQLPTHNMLLAFLLLRLSLHAVASPLLRHEVEEVGEPLRRRQDPTVAITGINAYGVQPRLEIRQLEQNVDQWNIFLLGLVRFQLTDQSNMTSYYQIAGIHGRPYIPWDNVPSAEGIDSPGYCTHVLNLFLAWHRPYLALYEQTLYTHIIAAVNSFPAGAQRQRYTAAALVWRFPYWDWAAAPPDGESVFPASVQSPTVNVTTPNGTASIPNPLFSYQFHPVSASDFYFNPVNIYDERSRRSFVLMHCASSLHGTRLSDTRQAGVKTPSVRMRPLLLCSITTESRSKTVCITCLSTTTTLPSSVMKHGWILECRMPTVWSQYTM